MYIMYHDDSLIQQSTNNNNQLSSITTRLTTCDHYIMSHNSFQTTTFNTNKPHRSIQ